MKLKKMLRTYGPGIITGAADDDPSGIATYSQTGAQFGYGQLWMSIFMLPLQVATQEACARIAGVTGKGIAAIVKEHYSQKLVYLIALLLLIANTINIGANIGAMAAAAQLLIPLPFVILAIIFALFMTLIQVFTCYKTYAKILKWLCVFLIAYPITVFICKQPWLVLLKSTFIPHIEFNFQFLFVATAVLGTTISPYMFFWQASQTIEEEREAGIIKNNRKPAINKQYIRNLRIDNFLGMFISELVAWCIIVVAATVLHENGVRDISSATEAAKALEPLVRSFPHSGFVAEFIFAAGIIGLGLLSVPILAGSAAYVLGAAFGLPRGLNLKFNQAKGFYSIILLSTALGLSFNFIGINPMKALVYASVINGIIAVPLLLIIFLIAKNKKIMGKYKSGILSSLFIFLTFVTMLLAAGMMLLFLVNGS